MCCLARKPIELTNSEIEKFRYLTTVKNFMLENCLTFRFKMLFSFKVTLLLQKYPN